ncbi:gar2 [Culex quinquefasciatus]|uniref:Gar2 n=1 Tax=Culex quinquefasciatus TaxID=7176 RepID=B0X6T5_CULQU|nr:gar2 [Culex quinquefasciatus]|eukprot:XP_001865357.1 gar2 [Culex quinquefasciatus]
MLKRKIARIYLISDTAQLQWQVGQPSQSRGLQVARDERVQSVGGVGYPKDFLLRLQHTFLGIAIVSRKATGESARLLKGIADTDSSTPVLKHDIYNDGMLLNTTEDIDGVPMQSSEDGTHWIRFLLLSTGTSAKKSLTTGDPRRPSTYHEQVVPPAQFPPLLQQKPRQERSVPFIAPNQQQVHPSPTDSERLSSRGLTPSEVGFRKCPLQELPPSGSTELLLGCGEQRKVAMSPTRNLTDAIRQFQQAEQKVVSVRDAILSLQEPSLCDSRPREQPIKYARADTTSDALVVANHRPQEPAEAVDTEVNPASTGSQNDVTASAKHNQMLPAVYSCLGQVGGSKTESDPDPARVAKIRTRPGRVHPDYGQEPMTSAVNLDPAASIRMTAHYKITNRAAVGQLTNASAKAGFQPIHRTRKFQRVAHLKRIIHRAK